MPCVDTCVFLSVCVCGTSDEGAVTIKCDELDTSSYFIEGSVRGPLRQMTYGRTSIYYT